MNNIPNSRNIYIALAAIPILIWGVGVAVLLSSPYTGMRFEYKNNTCYIRSAQNAPQLNNKEILAIEKFTITGKDLVNEPNSISDKEEYDHFWEAKRYLTQNIHKGQPVNIKINDNNTEKVYSITPTDFSITDIISAIGLNFLVTFVTVVVGLLIVFKKTTDLKAKVFFLGTLVLSIHNTTLGIYNIGGIILNYDFFMFLIAINSVTACYSPVALLYFYLIFPKEYKIITNPTFNILIFWIIPLTTAVLFFFRITYFASLLVVLAYIIVALFVSARSYFGLQSPVVRNQVKWVLLGMTLLVVGDVFLYIIPLLMGYPPSSYYFLALIPILATMFAISRYHLMDIDTLIDYSLIYAFTIGILSIIDIAVITTLTNFGIFNMANSKPVLIVLLVWITILAYVPVRDQAYRLIKKIFKREDYDVNQLSLQLQQEILSSSDIDSILQSGMRIIEKTLYPKKIEAISSKQDGTLVIVNEHTSIHLNEIKKITPISSIIKPDAIHDNYDGGLILPINSDRYFVLQNKQSGNLYNKEDMKLLSLIAGQAALAIEAISHKEALNNEKERISREIHDGIGSNLTKAILISENMSNSDNPERNAPGINELKRTLSESLNDIRELIWTVENKENRLDDVISYIFEKIQYLKNQDNVDFALYQEINNQDIIIPPAMKLNIVRIIQEAITNILKHSQATKISLCLIEQKQLFTITIQDNGIGFDTNKISPGYGLRNMYKRVEESKGMITITSKPQEGTKVEVSISL